MNQQKKNYQKELEKIITSMDAPRTVFLHSCCAPCSSYCMEYLRQYFDVTVFYYNPNIMNEEEYRKRVAEQQRLIAAYNQLTELPVIDKKETNFATSIRADMEASVVIGKDDKVGKQSSISLRQIAFVEGNYDVSRYLDSIKGLEDCKEGGSRCERCFTLRLRETARVAKELGMDYFTTTLTISPLKNAQLINEIGNRIAEEVGIAFLPSDFKKNNGYLRSIELSKEYDLYRQNYCGCDFSKQ